jgi:hypothetical protein
MKESSEDDDWQGDINSKISVILEKSVEEEPAPRKKK